MHANAYIKDGKALVSKVKYKENLRKTIERSIKAIGGLDKLELKGKTVLLKPNFVFPLKSPVTTDLQFLRTVIEIVKDQEAKRVIVGESAVMYRDSRGIMEELGVPKSVEKAGAELHIFDEHEWISKPVRKGGCHVKKVSVPAIFDEVDSLILLPCLKTHYLAQFSMSIKLMFGALKKIERTGFHLLHREQKFAELASVFNPDLIITDGRKAFVTGGPSEGELVEPGVVISSGDYIANDIVAVRTLQNFPNCNLRGIDPWQLRQIKHAVEIGLTPVKSDEGIKLIEG